MWLLEIHLVRLKAECDYTDFISCTYRYAYFCRFSVIIYTVTNFNLKLNLIKNLILLQYFYLYNIFIYILIISINVFLNIMIQPTFSTRNYVFFFLECWYLHILEISSFKDQLHLYIGCISYSHPTVESYPIQRSHFFFFFNLSLYILIFM